MGMVVTRDSKDNSTVIVRKLMFNLDDYVSHKLSGYIGKVVAYGHQMVDGAYQPTIRVKVTNHLTTSQTTFIEDLATLWERVERTLNENG